MVTLTFLVKYLVFKIQMFHVEHCWKSKNNKREKLSKKCTYFNVSC